MAQMAQRKGKSEPEAKESATTKKRRQQRAVVDALQAGCSRVAACESANLPRRTFYNWLEKEKTFRKRVEEAEHQSIRTMESVVYAAGLKAEEDPRYLRASLAWLTNKAGWRQRQVIEQMDVLLSEMTDEQLQRIAHGESPIFVLADPGARRN